VFHSTKLLSSNIHVGSYLKNTTTNSPPSYVKHMRSYVSISLMLYDSKYDNDSPTVFTILAWIIMLVLSIFHIETSKEGCLIWMIYLVVALLKWDYRHDAEYFSSMLLLCMECPCGLSIRRKKNEDIFLVVFLYMIINVSVHMWHCHSIITLRN